MDITKVFGIFLLGSQLTLVTSSDKIIKVKRLYACPDDNKALIPFKTNTFKTMKSDFSELAMSLNFTIPHAVAGPISFHLQTNSCNVVTRICEEYPSWDFADICLLFHIKLLNFFSQFQPPIKSCPVASGIYAQSNLRIDMTPFKMIINSVGRKYTTQVMFGWPGPKTILCLYMDYNVLQKRN